MTRSSIFAVALLTACQTADADRSPVDAAESARITPDGEAGDLGRAEQISEDDADTAWSGSEAMSQLGETVRFVGDIDGDGAEDYIAGAHGTDGEGTDRGSVVVVFGQGSRSGGLGRNRRATWSADVDDARLGQAVAPAGDVDGDGYTDFIATAPGDDDGLGRSWLVYGSAGLRGNTTLSAADHAAYISTNETEDAGQGHGLSPAGDVDGDGYADFMIGSSEAGHDGLALTGAVHLVYGSAERDLGEHDLAQYATWTGESDHAQLGARFAMSHGDLDGDGLSDMVMGAAYEGEGQEGAVYVWNGSEDRYVGSQDVADADVILDGPTDAGNALFGFSSSAAGDLNGDGHQDLAVGAYYNSDTARMAGAVYVFYGSADGLDSAGAEEADLVLRASEAGARLGRSVSIEGDLDGDGTEDLVAGMYGSDGDTVDEGSVVVLYGADDLAGAMRVEAADLWITGGTESGFTGYGMATGGDVDGDGKDDLLVGAPRQDDNYGRVSLFLGRSL